MGRLPRGYNHDVRYHGRLLHVQSEVAAGGHAHVRTQLFLGGTVLASQREVLGDGLSTDEIDRMMRAQHVAVLRELTRGCYDQALDRDSHVASLAEPEPERLLLTREPVADLRKSLRRRSQQLEIIVLDEGTVLASVVAELRCGASSVAVQRAAYPPGADAADVTALMHEQLEAMIAKVRRGGFDARLPGYVFQPPPLPSAS